MRKSPVYSALTLLAGLFVATAAQTASPPVVEFSADVFQKGPQGGDSAGRIYVSKTGMRTEMTQNGQQVIQIFDSKTQTTRMILPAQKSYMEFQGAGNAPAPSTQQPADINPCMGVAGAKCRNLGQEKVGGRPAVKWEMTMERQGTSLRSTQWIDIERGVPLRQEMPNGQSMEQTMLGEETLSGRKVEKWEMTMAQGNQAPQRSYRWFDPQLNMAVREEFPGGYAREMRNIKIGPQDASLFQVPAGYKKMSPQQFGQPGGRR